ncbi:MAG: hypothetical protein AAFQ82_20905, partial [Myxococcota bacterium]
GVEACAGGGYLAVIPDVEVKAEREDGTLWRMPCEALGSAYLVACARSEALKRDVVTSFMDSLRHLASPVAVANAAVG